MILENEINKLELKSSGKAFFKKSLLAFALFLISIASNVPGYAFPVKYHNIMLILSGVSLFTILIAVVLAIINLVHFIRKPVKTRKGYIGLALNLLLLIITFWNMTLLIIRLR